MTRGRGRRRRNIRGRLRGLTWVVGEVEVEVEGPCWCERRFWEC